VYQETICNIYSNDFSETNYYRSTLHHHITLHIGKSEIKALLQKQKTYLS